MKVHNITVLEGDESDIVMLYLDATADACLHTEKAVAVVTCAKGMGKTWATINFPDTHIVIQAIKV